MKNFLLKYFNLNISLNFKPPQPVESWNNILDAIEHGSTCVQPRKLIPNPLPQNENCLFLNVYVPGKNKENLSVILLYSDKIMTLFYLEHLTCDYLFVINSIKIFDF